MRLFTSQSTVFRAGLVLVVLGCGPAPSPVGETLAVGRVLLAAGRLREADAVFRTALVADPGLVDAHRGLAAVAYDQGALIQAVSHLQNVARLDPADGRPHRMIGIICGDLDRREEAVAAYRAALTRALTPAASAEVREELAEQLLRLGLTTEAVETLPADAGSARAEAIRIEAAWSLDGADAAADRATAAAIRHPESTDILTLLGRLRAERGDWESAAAALQEAVRLAPGNILALTALATTLRRLDRPDEADESERRHANATAALERLTTLTRVADERPWDPAVRLEAATFCEALGRHDLARMWRQAAVSCGMP